MPTLADVTDVPDRFLDLAVDWYAQERIPAPFQPLHPALLATARRISGGDWRRCTLETDGAIVVHNRPVWQ